MADRHLLERFEDVVVIHVLALRYLAVRPEGESVFVGQRFLVGILHGRLGGRRFRIGGGRVIDEFLGSLLIGFSCRRLFRRVGDFRGILDLGIQRAPTFQQAIPRIPGRQRIDHPARGLLEIGGDFVGAFRLGGGLTIRVGLDIRERR